MEPNMSPLAEARDLAAAKDRIYSYSECRRIIGGLLRHIDHSRVE